MASQIQTQIVHVVGQAAEKYVLLALLAGAIAAISDYFGYGGVATVSASAAVIAAFSAASAQYVSTGSIPGTAIPISTLLHLGYGALLVVVEKFVGVTSWTTPTIIAAVVLFLGTLLSEVQQVPSTQAGSTPTPPAAGPPSP